MQVPWHAHNLTKFAYKTKMKMVNKQTEVSFFPRRSPHVVQVTKSWAGLKNKAMTVVEQAVGYT